MYAGTTVTVHGTGGDDRFEVEIGVSDRLTINGTVHDCDPGQIDAIVIEAAVENPTKSTPGTTPDIEWAKVAWLYDFENCVTKKNQAENLTQRAVDGILTALWSD